jgi:hypothetical protein
LTTRIGLSKRKLTLAQPLVPMTRIFIYTLAKMSTIGQNFQHVEIPPSVVQDWSKHQIIKLSTSSKI